METRYFNLFSCAHAELIFPSLQADCTIKVISREFIATLQTVIFTSQTVVFTQFVVLQYMQSRLSHLWKVLNFFLLSWKVFEFCL